jgi:hypothetical protein
MELSNSRLMDEQFQYADGGMNWWEAWASGFKTEADAANSALSSTGTTASNTKGNAEAGSVNDGRRENDGSVWWKDILLAGADVVQQFGNQAPVDNNQMAEEWESEMRDERFDRETRIMGMHPITFGVVALGTIVVGGIVIYRLTKKD